MDGWMDDEEEIYFFFPFPFAFPAAAVAAALLPLVSTLLALLVATLVPRDDSVATAPFFVCSTARFYLLVSFKTRRTHFRGQAENLLSGP